MEAPGKPHHRTTSAQGVEPYVSAGTGSLCGEAFYRAFDVRGAEARRVLDCRVTRRRHRDDGRAIDKITGILPQCCDLVHRTAEGCLEAVVVAYDHRDLVAVCGRGRLGKHTDI